MAHLYTESRLEARATKAFITGYTETYGIYHVIDTKGKRFISKNPKTIAGNEVEEEETILPIMETNPQTNHIEQQTTRTPERPNTPTFGTPEGQLLIEASQPVLPEPPKKAPRRSERIRDQGSITP